MPRRTPAAIALALLGLAMPLRAPGAGTTLPPPMYTGPMVMSACYNQSNGSLRIVKPWEPAGCIPPAPYTSDSTSSDLCTGGGAYDCRATEYFVEMNTVGPQGPVGPVGPPGPAGPRGERGDTGATGPQGFEGPMGPQGEMGPPGAMGPQGAKGDQGDRGETGGVGPAGPAGEKGERGETGATGPAGPQGPIGPSGPAGGLHGVGSPGRAAIFTGADTLSWSPALTVLDGGNVQIQQGTLLIQGLSSSYNITRDAPDGQADLTILSSNNRVYDGAILKLGGLWGPTAYLKTAALNGTAGELILGNRRGPSDQTMAAALRIGIAGNVDIMTPGQGLNLPDGGRVTLPANGDVVIGTERAVTSAARTRIRTAIVNADGTCASCMGLTTSHYGMGGYWVDAPPDPARATRLVPFVTPSDAHAICKAAPQGAPNLNRVFVHCTEVDYQNSYDAPVDTGFSVILVDSR